MRRVGWTILLVGCAGRGCQGCRGPDTGADCAEADQETWYLDQDGDGHGDPDASVEACAAPEGAVASADDCDDDDARASALVDAYADADGDGYGSGEVFQVCEGATGWSVQDGDCDDADEAIYPGSEPICGNDLDDDCDGLPDCSAGTGTLSISDADVVRLYGEGEAAFGEAVIGPGDVDGDGIRDVLVGAPQLDGRGAALLFQGPFAASRGLSEADLSFPAVGDAQKAGSFLASGDLDGDQYIDLVIAAPEGVRAEGGQGVYVAHGPFEADTPLIESSVLDFLTTGDQGGIAAGVDLCEGEEGELLYFIGSSLYLFAGPIASGGSSDAWGSVYFSAAFGAVVFAGDLNADGSPDVAASGPDRGALITATDEYRDDAGLVAVFYEPRLFRPEDAVDEVMSVGLGGEQTGSLLGQALAPAGDVDGDGYDDLLVGSPGLPGLQGEEGAGVVYLISGATLAEQDGAGALPIEDHYAGLLLGDEASWALGGTLAGNLDLDSEGAPDFAAGAPAVEDEQGAVFLWYGALTGKQSTADAPLRLDGLDAGDRLGASLANAGDLNGLGWDDLLIGAPGADGGDGAVWILIQDAL